MLNKSTLIRKVNKITKLPLREVSVCVDVILDSIAESISNCERIELRGLGSFFTRSVKARKNFSTQVPSHNRIVFRPSRKLREAAWNKN